MCGSSHGSVSTRGNCSTPAFYCVVQSVWATRQRTEASSRRSVSKCFLLASPLYRRSSTANLCTSPAEPSASLTPPAGASLQRAGVQPRRDPCSERFAGRLLSYRLRPTERKEM